MTNQEYNEVVEACAKECENYMRDCLYDKDVQKRWRTIEQDNLLRAKEIRGLKK